MRFFKEKVKLYGVKTSDVTRISKDYFKKIKIKDCPKEEIFSLCEVLWQSGYLEESFIACNWSCYAQEHFEPDDFYVFENWLQEYVSNWASCDTFCNHTIGVLLEKHPQLLPELYRWTKAENRWVRRGAAVSLIIPARRGKFQHETFRIAESLLIDKDDLVQKGYGWLLKTASQADEKSVFDFVMERKRTMPRTALCYAIEKMQPELKRQAMQK